MLKFDESHSQALEACAVIRLQRNRLLKISSCLVQVKERLVQLAEGAIDQIVLRVLTDREFIPITSLLPFPFAGRQSCQRQYSSLKSRVQFQGFQVITLGFR